MSQAIRIGLIGYGFMGRTHSNAYSQVGHFFPKDKVSAGHHIVRQAVCGRDEAKVKDFAAKWGYASYETDWRKLVARADIDAVDICTPNDSHAEIALECIKNCLLYTSPSPRD